MSENIFNVQKFFYLVDEKRLQINFSLQHIHRKYLNTYLIPILQSSTLVIRNESDSHATRVYVKPISLFGSDFPITISIHSLKGGERLVRN